MSTPAPTADLAQRLDVLSAEELVRWAVEEGVAEAAAGGAGADGKSLAAEGDLAGGVALTTSFGIQSAVMLHMVTRVKPDLPIIWVDTGYLHEETYCYAKQLTARLDLNLQVYQATMSPARMEALEGKLWESGSVEDLNRYDQLRKVEPLRRGLEDLGVRVWLSGLRGDQTDHRALLPRVEPKAGRLKLYPILRWTAKDVYDYRVKHELPHHPLFDQGYTTVGDWHSSRPATDTDGHERDSRYGGLKQECGIHVTGHGDGI